VTNIPKPEDLHPVITEKLKKLNAIQAKAAAMKADCAIIRARMQHAPSQGNAADNRVRAALGEPLLADTAPDMDLLHQKLKDLDALNGASGILSHQIYNDKVVASKMVCDAIRPEVTKRAKAFATALLNLYAVNAEYDSYLDSVENSGTSISSLNRIFLNSLGSTRDPCAGYHYSLMDFVDGGIISREEMPKEIR
jgi:hypothetical protein